MPPDENPTEVLDLDEPYDDLVDEDITGDADDFDDADDTGDAVDGDEDGGAVSEYLEEEREDDDEPAGRGRRGGRALKWAAALAVLVLLAGGSYFGARELLGLGYEDYEGTGERDVVLEVEDGDITSAIAAKLAKLDVVASSEAFIVASEDDRRVLAVQPGYYRMKTKMSGEAAVERLVDESSRVGHLEIKPGTQLSDIIQPDDSVTPGVYSLLSEASCAKLNGKSTCVSPEKLRETAGTADLAELGVPNWAVGSASEAEKGRKLEGLIAPGVYDVKPGWNAKQLLSEVLRVSATRLEAAGLPSAAGSTPFSPYQILVIASLVEREAVRADFGKVASVIHNRMELGRRLELDSTVNYLLERPEITTDDEERAKQGPYNTYSTEGLPPTPIASPSKEAIEAALDPPETEFLYFVKCETNGLSCFTDDYQEHLANRDRARARGVY